MRPTYAEQLDGIARILEEVVAPELDRPYPRDVLAGLVGTLRVLAEAHDEIPGFVRWDTAATLDLLARAGVELDVVDGEAPDARHERARAALEEAIPTLSADPDLRAALMDHFAERADRFPFAFTPGGQSARPSR
jgi:hypothetical protein